MVECALPSSATTLAPTLMHSDVTACCHTHCSIDTRKFAYLEPMITRRTGLGVVSGNGSGAE